MRIKLLAAGISAACLLALAGCGGSSGGSSADAVKVAAHPTFAPGSTMKRIADAGKIRIGVKFDQPPFGVRDLSGNLQGFDVDIARSIAGAMGIDEKNIDWVEAVSANREPFLQQNKVDMVIAAYSITPDRTKVVSFAGPYFVDHQDLMVKAGNPEGIKGPQDLAGKSVCAVNGTSTQATLRAKFPKAKIVGFDAQTKCVEALKAGQVDSYSANDGVLLGFAAKDPSSLQLTESPFSDEAYGVGIPKGETDFCTFINTQLTDMQKSGQYAKLWTNSLGAVYSKLKENKTAPVLPKLDACA
jgi:glutamate transport system substrate-binding protein